MADGATGTVEQRAESLFGFLDFTKVLQPAPEFLEFCRRDAGQWIARDGPDLSGDTEDSADEYQCRAQQADPGCHFTTSVARIAV